MKRSVSSTHLCRESVTKVNGCDLIPPTRAPIVSRNTDTWRPVRDGREHHTPGTLPKAYREEPGHIISQGGQNMCTLHTYLECSVDFSNICWRVEFCSVVLRPWRKPHWVSSSFDSIISRYLFTKRLAYTFAWRLRTEMPQ